MLRRLPLTCVLLALQAAVSGQAPITPAPIDSGAPRAPVYVLLFSTIDDPLQLDISEERLQRTLPLLARYRAKSPGARVTALYQFSGTLAEELVGRNDGTHLLDEIKKAAAEGLVEIGYDGTEEPTFITRPRPNLRRAESGEQRWTARSDAAALFLNEHKDRLTGEPDPDRSGGLRKVREVFGAVQSVAGASIELGGDPETLHQIRREPFDGIMPGLPEPTAFPARQLHGYTGSAKMIAALVSPDERSAPELFWQDDVLRVSDTSGEPVKVVNACDGPVPLQKMLSALDRSRPHVVRVRLGSPSIYLKPGYAGDRYTSPLQAAYDNVKGARLAPEGWQPRAEIDAAFGREEAVIGWLIDSFFPANAGSHFTSVAELRRLTKTSAGAPVTRAVLRSAANDLLVTWGRIGNNPPDFARGGQEYFSLADMFQTLATALAGVARSGAFPESVRLTHVYGPFEMTEDDGPREGTVTVAAVARAAATLEPALNDATWKPVPDNVVPSWVTIEGIRMNAAQFLRLMAEAYVDGRVDARLSVRNSYMFSGAGEAFPKSRRRSDAGAVWTLKPAVLARTE